jgi:hypothetical protein
VPTITAKGMLKVVAVLDPASLLDIIIPTGSPRYALSIRFPDRASTVLLADLNAKSVRKAQATIRSEGAENVPALVQGRMNGGQIEEAGLVVALKKKPGQPTEQSAPEPVAEAA